MPHTFKHCAPVNTAREAYQRCLLRCSHCVECTGAMQTLGQQTLRALQGHRHYAGLCQCPMPGPYAPHVRALCQGLMPELCHRHCGHSCIDCVQTCVHTCGQTCVYTHAVQTRAWTCGHIYLPIPRAFSASGRRIPRAFSASGRRRLGMRACVPIAECPRK